MESVAKPIHVMKCYCHRPLTMSKSHSEKNPGRLFLKCPKRRCNFFQWVDEKPRGKTKAWIEEGRFPREGYPRPRELFDLLEPSPNEMREMRERQEREELQKKRSREFKEKDRKYSENLRNGTPEERERERVYQEELKRTGGLVNDSMERRRWGLVGSFEFVL